MPNTSLQRPIGRCIALACGAVVLSGCNSKSDSVRPRLLDVEQAQIASLNFELADMHVMLDRTSQWHEVRSVRVAVCRSIEPQARRPKLISGRETCESISVLDEDAGRID